MASGARGWVAEVNSKVVERKGDLGSWEKRRNLDRANGNLSSWERGKGKCGGRELQVQQGDEKRKSIQRWRKGKATWVVGGKRGSLNRGNGKRKRVSVEVRESQSKSGGKAIFGKKRKCKSG